MEPEVRKDFLLKVKTRETGKLQAGIEQVLRKNRISFELRSASHDDLTYSVRLPLSKKTDGLTSAILALGNKEEMAVSWSDKKPDKEAA
jgi:hypothetical protein